MNVSVRFAPKRALVPINLHKSLKRLRTPGCVHWFPTHRWPLMNIARRNVTLKCSNAVTGQSWQRFPSSSAAKMSSSTSSRRPSIDFERTKGVNVADPCGHR